GERLNLPGALARAGELLSEAAPSQRRELVVISDFQRSNWSNTDFSVLPKQTRIELESVAPREVPANVAILRAGVVGRVQAGREVRLEVEVGNYSSAPRQLEVEVTLGRW